MDFAVVTVVTLEADGDFSEEMHHLDVVVLRIEVVEVVAPTIITTIIIIDLNVKNAWTGFHL